MIVLYVTHTPPVQVGRVSHRAGLLINFFLRDHVQPVFLYFSQILVQIKPKINEIVNFLEVTENESTISRQNSNIKRCYRGIMQTGSQI